jgi:polysaccharide biosynthesis protein PslE
LQRDLQAAPVVKSNMIRARYSNTDPERAMAVLEALATAYLDQHLQLHSNSTSFEFFDKQASDAQGRWKEAQQRLLDFQQSSGVASAAEEKELLLRRQGDLEASLHQVEADWRDSTRRIDSIRPRLDSMSSRVDTQKRRVPNQYSTERLGTMLAELQNRRTELLAKYRPTERIVTQLDQQIADTQKAFDEAQRRVSTEEASDINPLKQSLETELSRTEASEAGLRGRLQVLRGQDQAYHAQLMKLDQMIPQEQQLQREAKVAEENYLLYAKRREEARIGRRMDEEKIANVVLSEKARVPVAPKSRLSQLITLYVLGLAIGVLLIALLARMGRTVHTPWALEGIAKAPVLGTVPVHSTAILPERLQGF